MFTVVKNNKKQINKIEIEYELSFVEFRQIRIKQENTKRIQEVAVDFKGISTFCATILSSLQWVWQILHISLRE